MRLLELAPRAARCARSQARLALWEVNRRLGKRLRIRTKQGLFTLPPGTDDPISRSLYVHGQYELDFVTSAMAFLRGAGRCGRQGTGTVLDVGANNGVISIGMLTRGEVGNAIAIEPDPTNFRLLEENVVQNNLRDRFVCLNLAASSEPGDLEFELSESNFGDHRTRKVALENRAPELFEESKRRTITVEARTIDEMLSTVGPAFKDVSVLWIDVQGFEPYVFRGARELLAKGVSVVSEFWPYGMQRAGIAQAAFCQLAEELWSDYWVLRNQRFVRYPISMLYSLFDEFGPDGDFGSVIYTRGAP